MSTDTPNAHAGSGVLTLMVQQQCNVGRATAYGVVPPPDGAAGPAMKFWYKTGGSNPQSAFYSTPGSGALVESSTWQQSTVCLDPDQVGRPMAISFTIDRASGTCANTFPAEYAWVDDVEMTTDASCPTE